MPSLGIFQPGVNSIYMIDCLLLNIQRQICHAYSGREQVSLKKSQNYIRFDINKHKYPIRPSEEKGEL
jgi:hypothetical protein